MTETQRLEKLISDLSEFTDFYNDSHNSDSFNRGQVVEVELNKELKRQEAK